MQRPDPSPWQHSWGLPLHSLVTQSHFIDSLLHNPPFFQLILHRGENSRHFPVPDLFFNILDEISVHAIGEVLGYKERKPLILGQEIPVTAVV